MDDLELGVQFVFAVTAIDNDNNRSETATIEFSTDETGSSGPAIHPPEPPANLTARVYSATAAELFWDRADGPGFFYEVSRLGLRRKNTDGTSLFDDSLNTGISSYTYTVVATDTKGLRSKSVSITIDTSEYAQDNNNSQVSGINASNYFEVLSTVLDVFNGSAVGYGQAILDAPRFSDTRYVGPPTIVFPDPNGPPQVGPSESVICSNGGTAVFTPYESGLNEVTRGWNVEFDHCQDDVTVFDGQFRRLADFSERRDSSSILTVTTPERITQFAGSLEWKFAAARGDTFSRYWRMNNLAYTINEGGQTLFNLQDADTFLSIARPFVRRLGGGFSLDWQLSNGAMMSVGVVGDMQQENANSDDTTFDTVARYESGSLQINASDGSALILEADSGDADSLLISLTTNGSTESFTQDWTFLEPLQLHPLRQLY